VLKNTDITVREAQPVAFIW